MVATMDAYSVGRRVVAMAVAMADETVVAMVVG